MPDKSPDAGPLDASTDELLRHKVPPGLKRWGIIAAIAAVVIAIVGIALRLWQDHQTAQWTDDQAVPTVQVLTLGGGKSGASLNLPGDLQPFNNAPIYAQVSGYMQKWFVDIGATVKQGQLLAQIDPRTYQAALEQARGSLARDSATLANARIDLQRYQTLARQNAISNQQLATQQATVNSDAGVVTTDKAAVDQATINLAYTRITAPFGGVVTARNIDVGNYVAVGAGTAVQPLFTVADQSKLRLYVRVPQNYASYIRPGMEVNFSVPQYPARTFKATLAASANAVASATGTVLAQFTLDNTGNVLQPGAYADVRFPLPAGANGLHVPATALMFRDEGMQVAVVDSSNHVHLRTVTVLRDMGSAVDVAGGVTGTDRIIDNPPDSLREGDLVRVAGK